MDVRKLCLTCAFALALGLGLALLWALGYTRAAHAEPGERYVAPGGVDSGNACTHSGNPCATIQHAVDVAGGGDEIRVAAGTYTGVQGRPAPPGYDGPSVVTQVVYISKAVTVRGGYSAGFGVWDPALYTTTLDAEGRGRVILLSGEITATLESLRLTGGDAEGLGGLSLNESAGGGVAVLTATATLSACQLVHNEADIGGGIFLAHSAGATLNGNTMFSNTANVGGGVLLFVNTGAALNGNVILRNTAQDVGGGVYLCWNDHSVLNGNTIQGNTASGGGGIFQEFFDDTALNGNAIFSNTASEGGGVYLLLHDADATLNDNVIQGNTADSGGGVYLFESPNVTLSGNVIQGNTGSGVYLWHSDQVTLSDNSIQDNTAHDAGGGVHVQDSAGVTLRGNTVLSNTVSGDGDVYGGGICLWDSDYGGDSDDATLSGNVVQGNTASGGRDAYGGGIALGAGNATLNGNTIFNNTASGNRATFGGGVYLVSFNATMSGNTIFNNTVRGGGGSNCGGLYLIGSYDVTLSNNVIRDHTADSGGGVCLGSCNRVTLDSNTMLNNAAQSDGGGIYVWNSDDVRLDNNVIADNQAGTTGSGLYLAWSTAHLRHNTLARNPALSPGGGGIHVANYGSDTVALTNTILVSHSLGITATEDSVVTLNDVLWDGNGANTGGPGLITATHQITGNPAFVAPDAGDYHITANSAARDAGVALAAGLEHDVDGQIRPMDAAPDLGADEYPGVGLLVVKWPSAVGVNPGQTLTYSLVITNAGLEAATSVWLTDTLPALQRATAIATAQGDCTFGAGWGGEAACDLGAVAAGESVHITLTAQVSTALTLRQAMVNTVEAAADAATKRAQATTYGQNCYVRVNDAAKEYTSVQAAVDAAQAGDLVKVAGVCVGADERDGLRQQVYLNKGLTIQGGYTHTHWTAPGSLAYPTTLDALGQGRVLYITGDPLAGETINPTIERLRITGGDASGLGDSQWGVGSGGGVAILSGTATLSACQVTANTAEYGAGVYVESRAGVTLNDNVISGNAANDTGGGVGLSQSDNATLSGNTILDNRARWGDGGGVNVYQSDNAKLSDNVISGNTAWDDGGGVNVYQSDDATLSDNIILRNAASWGGGVDVYWSDDVTLSDNTILRNTAWRGGGVIVYESDDVTLSDNTILSNTASRDGGGVYMRDCADARLKRNVIRGNEAAQSGGGVALSLWTNAWLESNAIIDNWAGEAGSGVHVEASGAYLRHTTLARNGSATLTPGGGDGSGLYAVEDYDSFSSVTLDNTVLVSHTVGLSMTAGNAATLNGVLWYGNDANTSGAGHLTITHQITGNPAFAADGYHITPASAALDAGVEEGVTRDIDGEFRPSGQGPDLGADEITGRLAPNRAGEALPGSQAVYTHTLTNRDDVGLTFGFSTTSSQGWDVAVYTSGYPSSTLSLPYVLAPGEHTVVTVSVQVPSEAVNGMVDTTRVTATGSLGGHDTVTDTTTVVVPPPRWDIYLPLVLRQFIPFTHSPAGDENPLAPAPRAP